MWEMYNGRRAAREVEAPDEVFLDPQPKSMVAEASKDQLMELEWPPETPSLYRSLAEKCMSHEIDERPNLKSILRTLVQMTD